MSLSKHMAALEQKVGQHRQRRHGLNRYYDKYRVY